MSIYRHGIMIANRSEAVRIAGIGDRDLLSHAPLIDQLHYAMQLWKEEKRGDLVKYLRENDLLDHVPDWKLAQALFQVMPRDEEDWKLISSPLGERHAAVISLGNL